MNFSVPYIKKYNKLILTFLSFLGCLNLISQEIIPLDEYGKLKVTYELASKHLNSNATQIKNLENNTIDLNKYPDATLKIKVEFINPRRGHSVDLCPKGVCYKLKVKGFSLTRSVRPKLKSGHRYIIYSIDSKLLDANLPSELALTVYVKDNTGKRVGESNGYRSMGQRFNVKRKENKEVNVFSEWREIIESNDVGKLGSLCDDIDTKLDKLGSGIPQGLKFKILNKCKELNNGEEIVDPEQILWEETKKRISVNRILSRKREILELYIDDNPNSKFKEGAKARLIGIKNKIAKAEAIRVDGKRERERVEAFIKEFRIEEKEKIEGKDYFTISLAYTAKGNRKPDNISSNEFQVNPIYKGNIIEFKAPKGIEGEITFDYDDIDFSIVESEKSVNIYELSTFVGALSVAFIEKEDLININVIGGNPPFQLRFLSGSTIKKVEKIGLERTYVLKKSGELKSGEKMPDGKYTIQVYDSSGNAVEKAKWKTEFIVGNSSFGNLEKAILPTILLLIGLMTYLLYKKSQTSQKLSNSEKIRIERKLGIENRHLEIANNMNIDTYQPIQNNPQPNRNPKRKKNIIISKRKPADSGIQTPPTIPQVATYPRLKKVEEMNFPPGFFLGKPDEYKRVELSDLWEKTFVSDIYIKEIFAYRINQFVFSENKEILDSRGEKIPEIGGWIMGKYFKDNLRDKYVVSFERFIQIHNPLDKSTTQLTFGHNAWHDLEKAKDIYKDEELELVGWFHTHPGWGVFLSGEDINTHETYFTEPYHIAMELESVNEPHDVGFFSRRKEQGRLELNNRAKSYYRWSDFKQWLGKA